jgi:hypothetical protein
VDVTTARKVGAPLKQMMASIAEQWPLVGSIQGLPLTQDTLKLDFPCIYVAILREYVEPMA